MAKNKFVFDRGRYYDIISDLGDKYEISPVGGGLIFKVSKSKVTTVSKVPNQLIDAFAQIDLPDDDSSGPYPCKVNPYDRWNGWARPKFTLEVLKRVLGDADITIVNKKESEILARFGADGNGEEFEIYADKDGLWEIDGWVWDIVDHKGRYINSDGTVEPQF